MVKDPYQEHLKRAKEILILADENKKDTAYNVVKTTRAGYTTNAIIASMEADSKILVIEPTNKIAIETVEKASALYFNMDGADQSKTIRHLSGNAIGCSITKERISKFPTLKEMPYIRSRDCSKCDIDIFELNMKFLPESNQHCCQIKTIMEEEEVAKDNEEKYCPDVCTITYDKLITLLNAKNKKSKFFIDLIGRFDVILFDEFGSYLTQEEPSIEVFRKETIRKTSDKKESVEIRRIEDKVNEIIEFINELNDEKFVEDFKKFNGECIQPFISHTIKEILDKDDYPHQQWNHIAQHAKLIKIKGSEKPREVSLCEATSYKLSEWYSTLESMVEQSNSEDEVNAIKFLIELMQVMSSEMLLAYRADNYDYKYEAKIECIKIINKEGFLIENLQKFIKQHQITLFTDATMPSFDFDKKIENKSVKQIMFGDPAKTNSKMLLALNTNIKKYSKTGWYKKHDYKMSILHEIQRIIERYGPDNIIIWIPSKDVHEELSTELECSEIPIKNNKKDSGVLLTYYLSTFTRGVESDRKIGISIGTAMMPINALKHLAYMYRDHYNFLPINEWERLAKEAGLTLKKFIQIIEDFFYKKFNGHHIPTIIEPAKKLFELTSEGIQKERTNANTWQSISRSKDPEGKERSVVFCLGWNAQDIVDIKKQGGVIKHISNELIRTSYSQDTMISAPKSIKYDKDLSQIDSWMDGNDIEEDCIGFLIDIREGILEMCFRQPDQKISLEEVWLNIDKNLQVEYGTPNEHNGYLIGTIRTLIACNLFEYVTVTEPSKGNFEFKLDLNKSPQLPPPKFKNLNAELIIRILRLAYMNENDRVTYSNIRNAIRKYTEIEISDKDIKKALRAIERYGFLNFSTWTMKKSNKSKAPIIFKNAHIR